MRDCKTQKEKDENMRDTFLKMGCEVEEGYHYKGDIHKIPFKVISDGRYNALKGKTSWGSVFQGHKWDFSSIIDEDKNKLIYEYFNNMGIVPLEKYKNIVTPILFLVKDKTSKFYNLQGKISWGSVLGGHNWSFVSLNENDKNNFIKKEMNKMGITPLQEFKKMRDKIKFQVIDKNSHYYNYKGHILPENIIQNYTWNFHSLIQQDKDDYVKKFFKQIGLEPLENYKNSNAPILYKVTDKNNKYYGLKGKMSFSNVKQETVDCFKSLLQEEKDKYFNSFAKERGIKFLNSYKGFRSPLFFIVVDKDSKLFGLKGKISPISLRKGCSYTVTSLLPNEFKKYVDRICEPLKYKVIKYPKDTQDYIKIKTDNDNIWSVIFNNLTSGRRCPLDTTASFGERCLNELFKLNNIKFEYQKTINYNDGSWQFMDFYLPDYNMCIEYMGEQHYEGWNLNDFQYIHKMDIKKYDYCIHNNIKWIEVPYTLDTIGKITSYVSNILAKKLIDPKYSKVQYFKKYNDRQIINLFNKYNSVTKVSESIGISSTTVRNILKRHDIYCGKEKSVIQIDYSTSEIIKVYQSATKAYNKLNQTSHSSISACCHGKIKHAYGYKWMFLSDYRKLHPDFTDEDVDRYMLKEDCNEIKEKVLQDA
jgi:hypothetical protein